MYEDYQYRENRQKQEEERRKLRRVYSTALINELIKERQRGYDIPYDAFFQRDLELRAPNVTFLMTDEENEEYQRCYDDALYYVSNYCRFMTDKGMETVELREFQEKVIKTATDEVYLEDIEDAGPKNRNVIWMAARQSGKCHLFNTNLILSGGKPNKISEIYNKYIIKHNIISKIKRLLYKIYNML